MGQPARIYRGPAPKPPNRNLLGVCLALLAMVVLALVILLLFKELSSPVFGVKLEEGYYPDNSAAIVQFSSNRRPRFDLVDRRRDWPGRECRCGTPTPLPPSNGRAHAGVPHPGATAALVLLRPGVLRTAVIRRGMPLAAALAPRRVGAGVPTVRSPAGDRTQRTRLSADPLCPVAVDMSHIRIVK